MERVADPARASRLARAILSDVMLYNAEKVRAGIEHDDLFERLAAEIREARDYFASRVEPEVLVKGAPFERALVDVLVYRSGNVRSRIW